MKKVIFALSLMFLVVSVSASLAGNAKTWDKVVYPPQRELKIPETQRFELPNGLVLYILEDHDLPLIQAQALIRTGGRLEPATKTGLASITGTVMRTGGTTAKTGDQLDDELEALGAQVETSIDDVQGSASMSVLKEDIDSGLSILADVLMNPAFREDKIDLAKIEARDGIARRNDEPDGIADREFRKLMYGADSPYAKTTEYETINGITREDLARFHAQYFVPNNVILGVVGDFDPAAMKKKVETYFGSWKRGDSPAPSLPEVRYQFRNQVCFVRKTNVNQSNVRIGHIGGKMSDSDYYATQIAGRILGGGFSSRLFSNVRSKEGLAYSVWGYWMPSYDYPGIFELGGGTKSSKTVYMIKAMVKEVEKMTASEVTDQELKTAKDGILNSFVFNFDTRGEIVQRLMNYEYFGYPKDYIFKYRENIEKVTKQDVLAAAKAHFHPGELVILAVGNDAEFGDSLSTLGPVTDIDITIPEPEQTYSAPTAETLKKGKEILRACVTAAGAKNLVSVKDITQTSTDAIDTPMGKFEMDSKTITRFPDKMFQSLQTPMGEMAHATDGKTGWARTPGGTQDLDAAGMEDLAIRIRSNSVYILQNFENGPVTPQFLEDVEEGGKKYQAVLVRFEGEENPMVLYVEKSTGLILKKVMRLDWMGQPGLITFTFSDFRDVAGMKFPFYSAIEKDGAKVGESKVKEIKVNTGVTDAVFVKK